MKEEVVEDSRLFKRDSLWVICLLLAAVILYTSGLGDLPLRDWDEGIVAGVARNIWRAEPGSQTWLYPTINGDPYWNKPPLIHWLIALSYQLFGVSEWSTRLVPALLAACSVPLVYLIAKELFPHLSMAIFSALAYLTLLPVARHGRLAMLDGAIACWFCLGIWCLLRGKKHHAWLLGGGIALGLICLTKGIMMGVLLGGIMLLFTAWDSSKLLRNSYLWLGLLLGIMPAIAWYCLQYFHYGTQFLGISLGDQTFKRIWSPVSTISGSPWYYLLEIAKYSLPWLIFLPHGVKLAWANRHLSWGKLTLVWTGVYLLAISLMKTKLPWYVIPLYPGLSLLIGVSLGKIWQKKQLAYFWQVSLSFITLICWLGSIYYSFIAPVPQIDLALILLIVAISFTVASGLIWLRNRYFMLVVAVGFYLALLLLFNSSYWLWELNNDFPVKPVATMLQAQTPGLEKIYTNHPYFRPSLDFYSDRVVIPQSNEQLEQLWQGLQPVYLLINSDILPAPKLDNKQVVGSVVSWQLITKSEGLK
ncbi:MAG: glycosyltransferase family 39 protein [Hyellaceae cyanobacterium CSU_1_1]|nr:glycosyltransferase family 39 protein [Hyellaceae cyanobacterium CSU_1_1]